MASKPAVARRDIQVKLWTFSTHCPSSTRLSDMRQLHLFVLGRYYEPLMMSCVMVSSLRLGLILTSNSANTALRKLKSVCILSISFSVRVLFVDSIITTDGGHLTLIITKQPKNDVTITVQTSKCLWPDKDTLSNHFSWTQHGEYVPAVETHYKDRYM